MIITGKYPNLRMRRSRKEEWSRRLVRENTLSGSDFVLPIFLTEGKNKKVEIKSMKGVYRYSVDNLSEIIDRAINNKIPMIASFLDIRFGEVNNPTAQVKITNDITLGFISLNSSEKLNKSSWLKLLFFILELLISFY